MIKLKSSEVIKHPKYKLQIPHYHPLNEWLLGATNDNQGPTMMNLQSSEIIKHPQ